MPFPEISAAKITFHCAAFFGAAVYAARVASRSIWARLAALVVGYLFAVYISPPLAYWVEHKLYGESNGFSDIYFATAYLMGIGGVGLTEFTIGVSKNPRAFVQDMLKRGNK